MRAHSDKVRRSPDPQNPPRQAPITSSEYQDPDTHQAEPGAEMLEKSNSQYDSFLFWKQPIPAPDLSELEGVMEGKAQGRDRTALKRSQEEEVACAEYSSFNYWRAPIADIDSLMADLDLLLL